MFGITAIVFIAGFLPLTSSVMTPACLNIRVGCFNAKAKDGQDNVPPCTIGQNEFNCLAGVLSQAEASGTCSAPALLSYRREASNDAMNYPANCPDFQLPSYLQLSACETQIGKCGFNSIKAYRAQIVNDTAKKCSEVDEFVTCVGDANSCNAFQREDYQQSQLTESQYQDTCIPSFTYACSGILAPCNAEKNQAQMEGRAPCTYGATYVSCLVRVIDTAESDGTCSHLAASNLRQNILQEVTDYANNCDNIDVSPALVLSPCDSALATCGSFSRRVLVNSRAEKEAEKCTQLTNFKNCMENDVTSCTNSQEVDSWLQADLAAYSYQTTCLDTTKAPETTSAAPTTKKPTVTQRPAINNGGGDDTGNAASQSLAITWMTMTLTLVVCLLKL